MRVDSHHCSLDMQKLIFDCYRSPHFRLTPTYALRSATPTSVEISFLSQHFTQVAESALFESYGAVEKVRVICTESTSKVLIFNGNVLHYYAKEKQERASFGEQCSAEVGMKRGEQIGLVSELVVVGRRQFAVALTDRGNWHLITLSHKTVEVEALNLMGRSGILASLWSYAKTLTSATVESLVLQVALQRASEHSFEVVVLREHSLDRYLVSVLHHTPPQVASLSHLELSLEGQTLAMHPLARSKTLLHTRRDLQHWLYLIEGSECKGLLNLSCLSLQISPQNGDFYLLTQKEQNSQTVFHLTHYDLPLRASELATFSQKHATLLAYGDQVYVCTALQVISVSLLRFIDPTDQSKFRKIHAFHLKSFQNAIDRKDCEVLRKEVERKSTLLEKVCPGKNELNCAQYSSLKVLEYCLVSFPGYVLEQMELLNEYLSEPSYEETQAFLSGMIEDSSFAQFVEVITRVADQLGRDPSIASMVAVLVPKCIWRLTEAPTPKHLQLRRTLIRNTYNFLEQPKQAVDLLLAQKDYKFLLKLAISSLDPNIFLQIFHHIPPAEAALFLQRIEKEANREIRGILHRVLQVSVDRLRRKEPKANLCILDAFTLEQLEVAHSYLQTVEPNLALLVAIKLKGRRDSVKKALAAAAEMKNPLNAHAVLKVIQDYDETDLLAAKICMKSALPHYTADRLLKAIEAGNVSSINSYLWRLFKASYTKVAKWEVLEKKFKHI